MPARNFKRQLPAPRPDFQALWRMLVGVAEDAKNDRVKAILTNHSGKQEYICRKLGVICAADVARLAKKFHKPIAAPKA